MTSRSHGYSSHADWDPMQDDFDNSNYDTQYPDDNASDNVKLDHTRLYITNIPKGLNTSALNTAFGKYGTLTEVFVNANPLKRYGLVSFETPAEARHAMMKLNKTEPLRLNISVAHMKKDANINKRDGYPRSTGRARDSATSTGRLEHNYRDRDDTASCGSRGTRNNRKVEEMANGDNLEPCDDLVENLNDELLDLETIDKDVQIELDRLQFERLKVHQAQLAYKQRILLRQMEKRTTVPQSQPSNKVLSDARRLPNRNTTEGSVDHRDGDSSFAAGAGDSLKLPGLQCVPTSACVVCAAPAYYYCARCGVTPYCSQQCQRKDWRDRHVAVCHNLVNSASRAPEPELDMGAAAAALTDIKITPAAPLRRPRSPQRDTRQEDNTQRKSHPPGFRPPNKPANRQGPAQNRSFNSNRSDDRQPRRNDDDWGANAAAKPSPRSNSSSEGLNFKTPPAKPNPVKESPAHIPPVKITIKREVAANQREVQIPSANQREPQTPPANQRSPFANKNEVKAPVANQKEVKALAANQKEVKAPVANQVAAKPPASVSDATPVTKLVPKNYMIELLDVGDVVMMSVDAVASECAVKVDGFVCLSLHDKYEDEYQLLCDRYTADCETEKGEFSVSPGETFSYFNCADGGWYRARCLSPSRAALVDAARLVHHTHSRCTRLPPRYHQPEFCCLLTGPVSVGNSIKCVLLEKSPSGIRVSIENAEDGTAMGEGVVSRWLPEVQYPDRTPKAPASGPALIPEVPRPDVANRSTVLVVHVTDTSHVYVRAADTDTQRGFDAALHDTALYGLTATPLTEPPAMGQYVVSKFTDGHHYRAVVKRTNVRQNKYLLEYVEFGNTQINGLENLYPCPEQLSIQKLPVVTSCVALRLEDKQPLTPPADKYLEHLKDDVLPLVLTIPTGAASAPSGCEVELAEAESKQSVNKKLQQLCTPEWMRLQELGQDMLDVAPFMFSQLEYLELPEGGCEVCVLDVSTLCGATVSGCRMGEPHMQFIMETLSERMKAYCESPIGSQPYLPIPEEICIAQMPPYPQWFRAVYLGPVDGPGSATSELCFIDYGNIAQVPTELIRKMPTEFVKGVPALATTMEIRGFTPNPTTELVEKAFKYMKVNEEGQGTMQVSRCIKDGPGMYLVDAPEMIAAMRAN
ncbi:uncharacterized protein LOC126379359 isoform X4 [Pectinophora gossypiella]|uniref:uncharacterized protein LOC126379359 isoform X4 n=1 Tax=Pectinophora gossypiella TaxID=13191 RepID=UPI00214E674F|nr:uncharacterized protein LOC126379359 isoform X4 [Pectinophora gossypiella]